MERLRRTIAEMEVEQHATGPAEATAQVEALQRHYRARNPLEAARNLAAALVKAEARIERTYPDLARPGRG